jgi:hypothetical protein
VAQPCFVVGGVDAFDDLAVGRRQTAAELHGSGDPTGCCPAAATTCQHGHYRNVKLYQLWRTSPER